MLREKPDFTTDFAVTDLYQESETGRSTTNASRSLPQKQNKAIDLSDSQHYHKSNTLAPSTFYQKELHSKFLSEIKSRH